MPHLNALLTLSFIGQGKSLQCKQGDKSNSDPKGQINRLDGKVIHVLRTDPSGVMVSVIALPPSHAFP